MPRLAAIVAEMRHRWPALGRIALVHRTGSVPVGRSSVVVAVSAPHRDEAFAAARFGIDTIKATVPIWKTETWDSGSEWGLDSQPIAELSVASDLPRPADAAHHAPHIADHEDVA